MNEPSIDLFHPVLLPEMEAAALEVLRSGQIASGPKVEEFERAFATIAGREYVVSTNDLTSSILLALYLAGVRSGDEVATLAFSCLQSNSPIARLGARPVWIDIDPATMSMAVEDLASKLTASVKAVMVYHVAGYPANTAQIAALCSRHGIPMIEDCNNAVGATLNGRPVGTVGEYAAYSLYPNRQINGIDGGVLATPNIATMQKATCLRRLGIDIKSFRDSRGEINPASDVSEIGWSAALNNLNAAVACVQLRSLAKRTARTRDIAKRLTKGLSRSQQFRAVRPVEGGKPAFWGLLLQSAQRDALLVYLKLRGVKCSILHQRNDWYTGFGTPRSDLPGTSAVMREMIAIPCGWWLSDQTIDNLLNIALEFNTGRNLGDDQ